MTERLIDKLMEYLKTAEGRVVNLKDIRDFLRIENGSKEDTNLRTQMSKNLVDRKIVSPIGKGAGSYKVIKQVKPVRVFVPGRERRPKYILKFPKDHERDVEIDFAGAIGLRGGDLITIGGVKSTGKTTLCLNFAAENIDSRPVLMGNEYTVMVDDGFEPAPRFLSRLDLMSEWTNWVDDDGYDKFDLLPVREDYAENIKADRINIIDWINLAGDKNYDIGKVLEGIKANLGRGIAIISLQKGEGAVNPRGGQYVRDFSDVEILLDSFGNGGDILLTLKGVKEPNPKSIVGRTYAYSIFDEGTKIFNFREVVKCPDCYGKGWVKTGNSSKPCDTCYKVGFVNK